MCMTLKSGVHVRDSRNGCVWETNVTLEVGMRIRVPPLVCVNFQNIDQKTKNIYLKLLSKVELHMIFSSF